MCQMLDRLNIGKRHVPPNETGHRGDGFHKVLFTFFTLFFKSHVSFSLSLSLSLCPFASFIFCSTFVAVTTNRFRHSPGIHASEPRP